MDSINGQTAIGSSGSNVTGSVASLDTILPIAKQPLRKQQYAIGLTTQGFSVIPCRLDKTPAISSWKTYQNQPCDPRLVNNTHSIGLVGGYNGVLVIDFDNHEGMDTAYSDVISYIKQFLVLETNQYYLETTPSGGHHLIIRCINHEIGNEKLVMANGKCIVESRGHGGYAVIHPSSNYECSNQDLLETNLQPISLEQLMSLMDYIRSLNSAKPVVKPAVKSAKPVVKPVAESAVKPLESVAAVKSVKPVAAVKPLESAVVKSVAAVKSVESTSVKSVAAVDDVIKRFNADNPVVEILEGYGYTKQGDKYLCPNSSTRIAGISLLADNRVFSHHASDPLGDNQSHDAFDVLTILEFNRDKSAAYEYVKRSYGLWTDTATKSSAESSAGLPDFAKYHLTETHNARLFREVYGNKVRHVEGQGWFVYNGKFWEADKARLVLSFAKELNDLRWEYIKQLDANDTGREKLIKWYLTCSKYRSIEAMLELAKSEHQIATITSVFDTDEMLFNAANGTINLKTGQLQPHNPDDLITQYSDIAYNPDAECPNWLKFLSEVSVDKDDKTDDKLVLWKQVLYGYSLTGRINEQIFAIYHGYGSNGKSTEMQVLLKVFGSYATETSFDTFTAKTNSSSSNEAVARLRGKRLVIANESNESQRLDEGLIKSLTGGEAVQASYKYGHTFEYKPEYQIILVTNHKPRIKGTDYGIWRRTTFVPFHRQFSAKEKDKTLASKLESEREGILAWLVKGCLLLQQAQNGLDDFVPEIITNSTQDYKREMDTIGQWLEECTTKEPLSSELLSNLHRSYREFCANRGEQPRYIAGFGQELEQRGYVKKKGHANKTYITGITLLLT